MPRPDRSFPAHAALVRAVFASLAEGDIAVLRSAMADDVQWHIPGTHRWSGTWTPRQAVLAHLLAHFAAQFREPPCWVMDTLADGGERVVVRARCIGVTLAGQRYDNSTCFLIGISRGRIDEIVEYGDSALRAALLQGPAFVPYAPG